MNSSQAAFDILSPDQELCHTLVEEIEDYAIFTLDPEGRVTSWNGSAERIQGYTANEILGAHFAVFYTPEEQQAGRPMAALKAAHSQRRWRQEGWQARKDGTRFWAKAVIIPLANGDGGVRGFAMIIRDMTGLKTADEQLHALQESEATLRAFLESASQGVVAVDAEGRIVLVNAKTEEMFGYQREELLGQFLEVLLPERLKSLHVPRRADYFAHPRVRPMGVGIDLAGRKKDGAEFPVEISLSPVVAGGRALALGFITDITERKRVETQVRESMEALRKSEATVRALLESASQGVVAVNRDGKIVLVNAKTEEMFDFKREELLGQDLEILLPERFRTGHVLHRADYIRQPRERPMGVGLDLSARRKDGTEFPVEISLSYARSEDGILAISFITDITERKRFEEQLRQTQKLESLGVLAGGVAHDFNNLLTGIMGGASFVLEILPQGHPAQQVLQSITRASERAASLTRQLLAYSGKGRFIIEPVDLSELIHDITNLIQTSIPKTVQLRLELSKYLPPVEADSTQIQQLVMNLIINGAEAIGEQPGVLTVRTGTRMVNHQHVGATIADPDLQPGAYVLIEVEDNGAGMTEEVKARIFDPFFTTKFTGRGLGLAAALGIVRGHKGAIHVESQPGRGSAFRVLLPVAAGHTSLAPEPRRGSLGTVLIADDEEVVRTMAKAALQHAGYDVQLAETGEEAVQLFVQAKAYISLVLVDLSMPVLSGDQVLERIRQIRPDVPVIVSSGYSEVAVLHRFAGSNIAGFLQKPYKSNRLVEAVNQALHPQRAEA
jgi:PAS domain S-box-containing protein